MFDRTPHPSDEGYHKRPHPEVLLSEVVCKNLLVPSHIRNDPNPQARGLEWS